MRTIQTPDHQTLRVVAFDFVGFGRSDKLTDVADYTFALHCQTLIFSQKRYYFSGDACYLRLRYNVVSFYNL